jgi:four helix bundle protein
VTLAGTTFAILSRMYAKRRSVGAGQDIRDRTFMFACEVVGFCESLYQAGGVAQAMAPQLLNSGTSIAAMLEEARGAESRRDFVSKCSIALKETRETHVRLRIHAHCRVGPGDKAKQLVEEANALVSILVSIVRNSRERS